MLGTGCRTIDGDEVARVLVGVLVLLDEIAQLLVGGVDELVWSQAGLVLDSRVRAGLEHHLDEGIAKGSLGGRLRVDPADGGVEGCVTLETG